MITGRSALAQQRGRALERAAVGAGPGARRRAASAALAGVLGLHEHVVEREVDERRPGVRRQRRGERLVDEARDLGRAPGRRGELGQRAHERDVVDLLQRALAPAHRRRAPAEDEHRRVVLLRRGDRAHPVGHAGPGGQRGDAGLARDLRPALGGERRGRLVADVDDVDALLAAAVVDREEVAAREREELRHAVGLQAPGDEPPAVELGALLGLGAHGLTLSAVGSSGTSAARRRSAPAVGAARTARRARSCLAAPSPGARRSRRGRAQQPAASRR